MMPQRIIEKVSYRIIKNLLISFYLIVFSLNFAGCATAGDPPPYFSRPKKSTSEEVIRYREERKAYIDSHPELSSRKKNLIELGMVENDFTKEEVKAAIRSIIPTKIEKGNFENGADEMWFYRDAKWNDYFYFKDGILIAQEKYRVKKLDQ